MTVAKAERRPLRWRAPNLLEDVTQQTMLDLDAFDWWHFRRLGAFDAALFNRLDRDREILGTAFDLYGFLYKPRPTVRRNAKPSVAASIVALLERRGDLERMRARTVLNEWATIAALPALLEPICETLEEAKRHQGARFAGRLSASSEVGTRAHFENRRRGGRRVHELFDHYEKAREALETFDRQNGLDRLPDEHGRRDDRRQTIRRFGSRESGPEPPWRRSWVPRVLDRHRGQLVHEMRERLDALERAKSELRETKAAVYRSIANGLDVAMNDACSNAGQRIDDALAVVDEVMHLFRANDAWGRDCGYVHELPLPTLVQLGRALRDNPSLREIVAIAGRWTVTLKRRIPRGRSEHGRSEAFSLDVGGDLARLAPSELTLLAHPRARRAVLARILERRALSVVLRGPHLLGRGPVVAIVDTSGSMSGPRIIMAKAMCLALALRCFEARRPFYVLTFGAAGELHETEVRAGADFHTRIERCLAIAFGGGTNFDEPLQRLCEIVRAKPWSQSDAIFITDGECCVDRETHELLAAARREVGLQVIGALVGAGAGLSRVADVVYQVDDRLQTLTADDLHRVKLFERIGSRL